MMKSIKIHRAATDEHVAERIALSRRRFVGHAGAGLGSIALAQLLGGSAAHAAGSGPADVGVLGARITPPPRNA